MENLKNVAPIEDFNWDAYENGESVASASHEELEKAYDNTLRSWWSRLNRPAPKAWSITPFRRCFLTSPAPADTCG